MIFGLSDAMIYLSVVIVPLAGSIYTKKSLDRELTDTYSLLLVVSDQGQPLSNSASATITIKAL